MCIKSSRVCAGRLTEIIFDSGIHIRFSEISHVLGLGFWLVSRGTQFTEAFCIVVASFWCPEKSRSTIADSTLFVLELPINCHIEFLKQNCELFSPFLIKFIIKKFHSDSKTKLFLSPFLFKIIFKAVSFLCVVCSIQPFTSL